MTHYCLDFCSLLNLYCGWGGIQELHKFGSSWSISTNAFNEFKYVRVQQLNGSLVNTPIAPASVIAQYPLIVHTATGPAELATYTALGMSIDDGEAESLAIAKHRNLTFVTDDGPAIAAAASLLVPTVSSLQLLIDWSGVDPSHPPLLPGIVHKIALCASFVPPKSSPYKAWWNGLHTPS